jgi:hypothetical protein
MTAIGDVGQSIFLFFFKMGYSFDFLRFSIEYFPGGQSITAIENVGQSIFLFF